MAVRWWRRTDVSQSGMVRQYYYLLAGGGGGGALQGVRERRSLGVPLGVSLVTPPQRIVAGHAARRLPVARWLDIPLSLSEQRLVRVALSRRKLGVRVIRARPRVGRRFVEEAGLVRVRVSKRAVVEAKDEECGRRGDVIALSRNRCTGVS